MSFETEEKILKVFMAFIALLVAAIFIAIPLELIQDYRTYDAQVSCQQKQMDYRRKFMSSNVICVPVPLRRDTLMIQTTKE